MVKRLRAPVLVMLCFVFCIATFNGCARKREGSSALKTIKIEATGPSGSGLSGTIRAASPSEAGMTTKDFEIKIPGSMEVRGGPSEYEIIFRGMPSNVHYTITVDGRELKAGSGMTVEEDKGPKVTFEIK
jgi:hypothetical protein